jgi:hypothetical protein
MKYWRRRKRLAQDKTQAEDTWQIKAAARINIYKEVMTLR